MKIYNALILNDYPKDINEFGDHEYDMSGHTAAYKKFLSLIDEVKPIQK